MTCIGTAYGASPLTFLGLAGVGDLFLTCSSSNSRNYTVGHRLGKGESLDQITKTLGSVAEGISTTKGVKTIVDELGVSAPIASSVSWVVFSLTSKPPNMHDLQVYDVLYNGGPVQWLLLLWLIFSWFTSRQGYACRSARTDGAATLQRTRITANGRRTCSPTDTEVGTS